MTELLQGSQCAACQGVPGSLGLLFLVGVAAALGLPLLFRLRTQLAFASMEGERERALQAAEDVLFRELVSQELQRLEGPAPEQPPEGLVGLSEVRDLARRFTDASRRRIEEARFLMAEEGRIRAEARQKAEELLAAVEEETLALAKAYELREEQLLRWGEKGAGTQGWEAAQAVGRGGRRR